MRHNRRGEPIGRESGVYLYGASRPEVCRKVDPVGVTSAAVRDQASTPLEFWPEPRNDLPTNYFVLDATERSRPSSDRRVESYPANESACFALSTNQERRIPLPFRRCARCVAANRPKLSSLSSSSPAIDALRGSEPRPAIRARIPETVFLVSKPKPNRQFLDCGELSPNSLEFLLRLFPAKRHSRHLSERPKLRYSSL